MFEDSLVATLAAFITGIGIPALAASSTSPTRFAGLDVQYGCVLIDESRLVYPGNILHEAGHIAVTDPRARNALQLNPTGGEELAALAWSYAAAMHLHIAPNVVFYPSSYDNFGDGLVESFGDGRYIGVPLLQTFHMTLEPKRAAAANAPPFPHMLRWLR